MTENTHTDCRSSTGKTVSIIDTIGFLCSLLKGRSIKSKAAMAAIRDLQNDENANHVIRKLAITKEEVERQEIVHQIVQRYRKDSPETKYREWLMEQIERTGELMSKAGQPKGHRQAYSAMNSAYKCALDKHPTTTIEL